MAVIVARRRVVVKRKESGGKAQPGGGNLSGFQKLLLEPAAFWRLSGQHQVANLTGASTRFRLYCPRLPIDRASLTPPSISEGSVVFVQERDYWAQHDFVCVMDNCAPG
jgi:hypothetical protein